MTLENCISIVSALLAGSLVAIGWIVNGVAQRRQDVAQRRLEYRLNALEAFLSVWFAIEKSGGAPAAHPQFLQQLAHARTKFQLYGIKDKIEHMESFIHAVETSNVAKANVTLEALLTLVRNRIRSELRIRS